MKDNNNNLSREKALDNFSGFILAIGIISFIAIIALWFNNVIEPSIIIYGTCGLIGSIGTYLICRVVSEISRTIKNNK